MRPSRPVPAIKSLGAAHTPPELPAPRRARQGINTIFPATSPMDAGRDAAALGGLGRSGVVLIDSSVWVPYIGCMYGEGESLAGATVGGITGCIRRGQVLVPPTVHEEILRQNKKFSHFNPVRALLARTRKEFMDGHRRADLGDPRAGGGDPVERYYGRPSAAATRAVTEMYSHIRSLPDGAAGLGEEDRRLVEGRNRWARTKHRRDWRDLPGRTRSHQPPSPGRSRSSGGHKSTLHARRDARRKPDPADRGRARPEDDPYNADMSVLSYACDYQRKYMGRGGMIILLTSDTDFTQFHGYIRRRLSVRVIWPVRTGRR